MQVNPERQHPAKVSDQNRQDEKTQNDLEKNNERLHEKEDKDKSSDEDQPI